MLREWSVARVDAPPSRRDPVGESQLPLEDAHGIVGSPGQLRSTNALGGWAGVGVLARIGTGFNAGVSVRYSVAELDGAAAGGGTQIGLTFGWGTPATR